MKTDHRDEIELKVGQVWADNDWRSKGRSIEVTSLDERYVYAIVRSDREGALKSSVGQMVRILRSRMRHTSTGYRLTDEASCVPLCRPVQEEL